MPIQFPTNLSVGEGSTHTLLDLRENKVQGIGFFDSLSEAQSLNANQRCLGYLALISDGTNPATAYQFINTDINSWTSNDSWAVLGSGNGSEATSARVLHHNLRTKVMMSQGTVTINGESVQQILITPSSSSMPNELELRFDGETTLGYDVDGGANPYAVQPEFARDLHNTAANQFEAVDGSIPLSSCYVTATVSIGDPTWGSLPNGIDAAYSTQLETANWTGTAAETQISSVLEIYYNKIAQGSVGGPTAVGDLAFCPIIPIRGGNGVIYWLSFNDAGTGPYSIADFTNSANWTSLYVPGDPPIAVYAWIYETGVVNQEVYAGGQSPSIQSVELGANIGATGALTPTQRIDTLAELKERLKIKLKLSNSAKSALANTVNSTGNAFSWKDLYLTVDVGITITQ